MTGDELGALAGLFGALILVLASLINRWLPPRQIVRLTLIWAAIFLFGYLTTRYITANFT